METLAACPVCGQADITPVAEIPDYEAADRVKYHLKRCAHCEAHFINPRPPEEEMGKYYRPTYYKLRRVSADFSPFKRAALSAWFGYPAPDGASLILARLLGPVLKNKVGRQTPPFVPGGTLLELGIGRGEFLLKMRRLGWQVKGVDISPAALRFVRQQYHLDACLAGSRRLPYNDHAFDVVFLKHTLEHIHHPNPVMGEIYRVLKPGGRVLITTPNVNSLGNRLFGSRWAAYALPRHLVLYNKKSLCHLLARHNLAVRSCLAPATNSQAVFMHSFGLLFPGRFKRLNRLLGWSHFGLLWLLSLGGLYLGEELQAIGEKRT